MANWQETPMLSDSLRKVDTARSSALIWESLDLDVDPQDQIAGTILIVVGLVLSHYWRDE